jgi:hypothetical protein
MSAEWNRGVLRTSSWHRLEELAEMPDADAMIAEGENSGAWPVELRSERLFTANGLVAPSLGIVATYRNHPEQVIGDGLSKRYNFTIPEKWREVVRAACFAGARPNGAFSLRGGSRVLATFEINGNTAPAGSRAAGVKSHLCLVDTFDGSMNFTCGLTSIDVVCANTLAAAMRMDGGGMAQFRHTASLEEKTNRLRDNIGIAIKTGQRVRDLMLGAENTVLTRQTAHQAFDLLFPEADKDADKAEITKANNRRDEAKAAAVLPINRVGSRGTLATLWNAATYLVDRKVDGSFRPTRSGDPLDSLLFGTRAQRIQEVQTIIEVILKDGTVQPMTATQAMEVGVDKKIVGAKILQEMIEDFQPSN